MVTRDLAKVETAGSSPVYRSLKKFGIARLFLFYTQLHAEGARREAAVRGLQFVRCADACVIAVRSESSAKRVMCSVPDWIERKLGFEVSAVRLKIARPAKLKYLRLGYYTDIQAQAVP